MLQCLNPRLDFPDCSTFAVWTRPNTSPVWLNCFLDQILVKRPNLPKSCQMFVKEAARALLSVTDLIVSCCHSMVKLGQVLSQSKRFSSWNIYCVQICCHRRPGRQHCVQICCHRRGPSHCFHPASYKGVSAACKDIAVHSSMLWGNTLAA